jgi:hypothetical protein
MTGYVGAIEKQALENTAGAIYGSARPACRDVLAAGRGDW